VIASPQFLDGRRRRTHRRDQLSRVGFDPKIVASFRQLCTMLCIEACPPQAICGEVSELIG
jgi:ferredoxin